MIIDLAPEAAEFGLHARRAIGAAGGDLLLRAAEADPRERSRIEPVLASLGAWELDPLARAEDAEAAAALCRSSGYWGVPYPVAERLCHPPGLDADASVIVRKESPVAAAAGLDLRWVAVDVAGGRWRAVPQPGEGGPRQSRFTTALELHPVDRVDEREVAVGLVLPCWTLLGMLDRALELTCGYVQNRHQFGQPLAAFQAVQFQLTDAEVERLGVEELAKYALWSIEAHRSTALDDALALRLATLEAADVVFRVAHQLHGAIGFCDESVLSWISRYSEPLRRAPLDQSGTGAELTRRVDRRPLDGMFTENGP